MLGLVHHTVTLHPDCPATFLLLFVIICCYYSLLLFIIICLGVRSIKHGSPHCNLASRLPCNRVQISDNCSGRFRKQIVQIIQKFRLKINLNIEVFHNHVIDIMVFVYFALSDLSSKASNWQTCNSVKMTQQTPLSE